ncbi:Acetyl-coenzyme A transporter 1 family protein [Babesia bovis T2Bo]|uniref:Acetyl-coenzyme A transporter 1 family protein n=1 Tax=Babesia bovis T2Bo TaxID=484906 RepID=UPI001D5BA6B9|nr:Acetyl-coenzyme A transporter 1 family protein [Babesia bovis T2Bo]EDO07112.2 Acetyl-coenzyme A transporter 1 family protein [Babesia bovis T2Bo]
MGLNVVTNYATNAEQEREHKKLLSYTFYDFKAIVILLTLYIIQGIPMGIHLSLPLIIYNKVSYSQMGNLSLTAIPLSLKLLWAPIMESLYSRRLGKRKCWIIPVQLITACLMLFVSANNRFDRWTGQHGETVDVTALLVYCTITYILMATQDVVVDGWALNMLRPEMRIHASTCNAAGQHIGINISYVCLTILSSNQMSRIINQTKDVIVTGAGEDNVSSHVQAIADRDFGIMSHYIRIFGIVTLAVTVLVMFIHEVEDAPTLIELQPVTEIGIIDTSPATRRWNMIKQSYALLIQILKLEPALLLGKLVLTINLIYSPEEPAELKLLEKGVPKDLLASITPFIIPLQIVGPPLITTAIRRSSSADVIYKGLRMRLLVVMSYVGLTYVAGLYYTTMPHSQLVTVLFYIPVVVLSILRHICELVVCVALVALFADVSDPSIGGTYMALLNALMNVGELVPRLLGFWMIDALELYSRGLVDGLLIEGLLCIILGVIVLPIFRKVLLRIESYGVNEWYVNKFAEA